MAIKQLIKNILITFLGYFICRVLFYLFNLSYFHDIGIKEFVFGSRFDLSAIGYLNIIIIFFQLLPIASKVYQKTLYVIFIIINLLAFATQFIDMAYYPFTFKRSNIELITAEGMRHEMKTLWLDFLKQYWYLFLLYLVFAWAYVKNTAPVSYTKPYSKKFIFQHSVYSLLLLGLLFLGARGGFQPKPIRVVDAGYDINSQNVALVLNTPFSILKSVGKNDALPTYNFDFKKEGIETYNDEFKPTKDSVFIPKNVVIFILESFGAENIGKFNNTPYTPFIDSLMTESLVYDHAYANGKVSIAALPSVVCGIPNWYNTSYINSKFVFNPIESFPKLLRNKGYTSSFFHGAFNGSQNFDRFADVAGFDKYMGKNEYPYPEHDDGRWGIWDEPFLQFFNKELSVKKSPFFATLFTLSSHNPYKVPQEYKNVFPKGTNIIHESIGYTDNALKKFFENAKKQDWFYNTLFVLTADHTSQANDFSDVEKKFHIPVLFFDPSNPNLKGENHELFQQIDILPWVMNYLNYDQAFISFGNKVEDKDKMVINYLDNTYWVFHKNLCFSYDLNLNLKQIEDLNIPYDLRKDLSNSVSNKDSVTNAVRALIQDFNNRNNENRMTLHP